MNNLNTVLIEGNLTKDPELSYTSADNNLPLGIFSAFSYYNKIANALKVKMPIFLF